MRALSLSRRQWILVAIGFIGFSVVGYGIFSAESDEEKIRAVLANLAHAVQVDADAPNILVRAGKVNKHFDEIFDDGVVYIIPEYASGGRGRKQLGQIAIQLGPYFTSFEVKFTELEIEIADGGASASASTRAVGSGITHSERWEEERHVQFELNRTDGEWRIARLTVVPKSELAEDE